MEQNQNETKKYADPTMDLAFKLLLGQLKNSEIIISLLNSLLEFKGDDLVQEIEVIDPQVSGGGRSDVVGKRLVTSTVDVLCKTMDGRRVAIEVQRQFTNYFLARTQYYMASMIYGRVPVGKSHSYYTEIKKNYMLIITDEAIFTDSVNLNYYETAVTPQIHRTGQTIKDNKMFWKFYELSKFRKSESFKNGQIDRNSPIKEQWLEFLCTCSEKSKVPDRSELILNAYKIMEMINWHVNEITEYKQQIMMENSEKLIREEELKKAHEKGKHEGKIEGQIKLLITHCKSQLKKPEIKEKQTQEKANMLIEPFTTLLKSLEDKGKQEHFVEYIEEHEDDSTSEIFTTLSKDVGMDLE